MSIQLWLAFAAALVVVPAITELTVILLLSHVLTKGRKVATTTAAEVTRGDFVALTTWLRRV